MTDNTLVCEIIISPVGTGVSVAPYIKTAVEVIRSFPDIKAMTHPMGTVFESNSLDEVFVVTKAAHQAVLDMGASRVVTQLRIDDRRDKIRNMMDKVDAVR